MSREQQRAGIDGGVFSFFDKDGKPISHIAADPDDDDKIIELDANGNRVLFTETVPGEPEE